MILYLSRLSLVVVAALAFEWPSAAQPSAPLPSTSARSYCVPLRAFAAVPFTLDPDEPRFTLGFAVPRWEAMLGGQIVIFGHRSPAFRLAVTLPALVELINLGADAVPYQSWRANLGLSVLASIDTLNRRLPAGGALWAQLGWYHESGHPTDGGRFELEFVDSGLGRGAYPDLVNFSSFEYVKFRLAYEQPLAGGRITLHGALAGRFFTPPINPGSIRAMQASFAVEAGLHVRIAERLWVWQATYFEVIANGFVAAEHKLRSSLDHDPLRDFRLEAGLDWRQVGWTSLVPWVGYADSHGRGVLFLRAARELTTGLRLYY